MIHDPLARIPIPDIHSLFLRPAAIKHPGTGQTLFTIEKRRLDRSEQGIDPAGREVFKVRKQTNSQSVSSARCPLFALSD